MRIVIEVEVGVVRVVETTVARLGMCTVTPGPSTKSATLMTTVVPPATEPLAGDTEEICSAPAYAETAAVSTKISEGRFADIPGSP